jgi:uncharacterized protein (DUF2147 family)
MKPFFATATFLALTAGSAAAAEPLGDWLVKDGYAQIRIDDCGGKLWGIIAWEKTPGGIDNENPDPAKKNRPVLGMPILLGMKATKPNLWEGEIYNSNNGKTYDAKISMVDDNTLKLQGCVWGVLCGGENWTRVTSPPPNAAPLPPLPNQTPVPPAKRGAAAKGAPPVQSDVCARVAAETPLPNGTKGASKQSQR